MPDISKKTMSHNLKRLHMPTISTKQLSIKKNKYQEKTSHESIMRSGDHSPVIYFKITQIKGNVSAYRRMEIQPDFPTKKVKKVPISCL